MTVPHLRGSPHIAMGMLLVLSVPAPGQSSRVPVPLVVVAPVAAALRPGDRVLLDNPVDPSRRESFDVDASGVLTLPRIGRISVAQIPALDIGDSIRARYSRFQKVDDVYIQVLRRVTLVGEVRRPGVFYFSLLVTVRDAVSEAGGVTEQGRDCCIELLRAGERRNVGDWQARGGADQLVDSGDIILVPREAWVKRNILALVSGAAALLSALVLVRR